MTRSTHDSDKPIIAHRHRWASLHGHVIHVKEQIRGTRIGSLYIVVEICDDGGCTAGRTRRGEVLADVSVGTKIRDGDSREYVTQRLSKHEKK